MNIDYSKLKMLIECLRDDAEILRDINIRALDIYDLKDIKDGLMDIELEIILISIRKEIDQKIKDSQL